MGTVKIIIGVLIGLAAIGFLFGVIALAYVREWQEYRRNGE